MRDLGIVTMFRNEAPYLAEWVEYHRVVGVDHFWLFDNNSTDDSRKTLAPYTAEGFVEVISWPGQWPANQLGALKEGTRRAIGETKWIALIDVDEFLLPMAKSTVPQCLDKYFSGACGVYVNWRMFGTSGLTVAPGKPLLTKLTACSVPSHPENDIGKSLVRPEAVAVELAWHTHHFPLRDRAKYFDGDQNELSFDSSNDLVRPHGYFDKYIRINHYNLRDESFFRNRRLLMAQKGELPGKSLDRLLEHYDAFGETQDQAVVKLLKKHHRAAFLRLWDSP